MIKDAIQAVLENIVSSFSPAVTSDKLPVTPFCVHDAKISETLREKEGIYGHQYELGIMVIGDDDAQIDPVVVSIISAIEAYTNTVIEECLFETMSGLQYDDDLKLYHNQLNFKVLTNNL